MREMRSHRNGSMEIDNVHPLVAVAIDKDKGSQSALKWTLDNLVTRGQTIMLLHVKHKPSNNPSISNEMYAKEIFLPFRCFCTRKDVHCRDIIVEDADVPKGIIEFVSQNGIEKLVVGSPTRSGFARRFRTTDIPTSITKGAPDFCTVYTISKGKVSSVRNALRQAPVVLQFRPQIQNQQSLKQETIISPYSAPSKTCKPLSTLLPKPLPLYSS